MVRLSECARAYGGTRSQSALKVVTHIFLPNSKDPLKGFLCEI